MSSRQIPALSTLNSGPASIAFGVNVYFKVVYVMHFIIFVLGQNIV